MPDRRVRFEVTGILLATVSIYHGPMQQHIFQEPSELSPLYDRYSTGDRLDRRITFYLTPRNGSAHVPLIAYIQGSGCQSAFRRSGDKITGGYQNILRELVGVRARVLVVEKPGVRFLDEALVPGTAEGATKEFLVEHTLPGWIEANCAAVRAARMFPGIDDATTLVVGHSEGAIVAAGVAAEDESVTHVASLAGDGPTQLFSLIEMARAGIGITENAGEKGVAEVLEVWRQILADPDSIQKSWSSHPYRRWSSFLCTSVTEKLLNSQAKIYLAHGTEDDKSPVAAFDVLYSELLARNRDVTAERLAQTGHNFTNRGSNSLTGMRDVLGRVLEWFLRDSHNRNVVLSK
jgi:predicted esterase